MTPEQEAKDPTTNPARLQELAEQNNNLNGDLNLVFFLVKNPNTPIETLLFLAEVFAQEFLENPALSLLFFEHTDFISKIPEDTMESLLKVKRMPLWFLEVLIVSPIKKSALEKLTQRDEVSGDFLEKLVTHSNPDVRQIAASAKAISPEQAWRLAVDESQLVLQHLAANPNIPADLLEELGTREEVSIRLASAKNPKATASQLQRFAVDREEIRREVARHNNTLPETLSNLAKGKESREKEYQLREHIAGNPHTPIEVLEALYQDKTPPTENPSKFFSLSAFRFNSYLVQTCQALALNPNTPVKILEELAQHEKYIIRQYVAQHAKLPLSTLEQLAKDPIKEVIHTALQNPRMPSSILASLINSPDEGLRSILAEHPNTPSEVLLQLATDSSGEVRAAVMENPKISPEALQILSADPHFVIRAICSSKPSLPSECLTLLSQDALLHTRASVAIHANTTAEILKKLSQDPEELVRKRVTENPNTPNEILDILSQDPDEKVRNSAMDKLREKSKSMGSCIEKKGGSVT
jgi:uncharacterized membrane-anchored protein YhcB (DUF1043 family)